MQVVGVCDRDGDSDDLLLSAQSPGATDVLVRAKNHRTLIDPEQCAMRELLAHCALIGAYDLPVPRRGNQKARTARMAVRCARVTIRAPKRRNARRCGSAPGQAPCRAMTRCRHRGTPYHVLPRWVDSSVARATGSQGLRCFGKVCSGPTTSPGCMKRRHAGGTTRTTDHTRGSSDGY
jgi:hypothetical protein